MDVATVFLPNSIIFARSSSFAFVIVVLRIILVVIYVSSSNGIN